MALEFIVFTIVIGNLGCAVLGFIAGKATAGTLRLDVSAIEKNAEAAAERLSRAKAVADKNAEALESAATSADVEGGIADIINSDRDQS